MMKKYNLLFKIGCVLFISFINVSHSFTQDFILDVNPAEVRDPRAAFVNPAIISKQGVPLVVGLRILHMGIFDNSVALKHSYFGASSDIPLFGFHYGANVQFFNYSKIREGRFSFLLSRPLIDILTVGTNLNILTRDYSDILIQDYPDNSDLILDELLSGTIDYSLGAGLFLGPYQDFTVGLSIDHINQPDVTMDNSGLRQSIAMDFGLQYNYGFFSPSLYVHHSEGETSTLLSVEGNSEKLGMIRMAFGGEKLVFEGQLNLKRNRMSIGYRLDYPLNELKDASYGSHQVAFIYRFKPPIPSIDAFFDIEAKFDNLTIIRKGVSIVANKGVSIEDIETLNKYQVNLFDENSRRDFIQKAQKIRGSDAAYEHMKLDKAYDRYKKLLKEMVQKKRAALGRRDVPIKIITPPGTGSRAVALLGFIVDSLGIPSDSVNIVFTPGYGNKGKNKFEEILEQLRAKMADKRELMKKVQINVISDESLSEDTAVFEAKRRIASANPVHSWRLIIKKADETVIALGGSKDPKRIDWDWRDKQNKRIRQGTYTYYIQWKDERLGAWKPRNPDVHSFKVKEKPSSLTYYIGGKVKPSIDEESIEIFLKTKDEV